jgi:hypothetical protein
MAARPARRVQPTSSEAKLRRPKMGEYDIDCNIITPIGTIKRSFSLKWLMRSHISTNDPAFRRGILLVELTGLPHIMTYCGKLVEIRP